MSRPAEPGSVDPGSVAEGREAASGDERWQGGQPQCLPQQRIRRLVVPAEAIGDDEARLAGGLHHYLVRVLRLGIGAPLVLLDGDGGEYRGRLVAVTTTDARVALEARLEPPLEPRPRLTLLYGLSRGHRTELVLQKATELGVDSLQLVLCERSVCRPRRSAEKFARWQAIVSGAARQCGRSRLPRLEPLRPLPEVLASLVGDDLRLLAAAGGEAPASAAERLQQGPAQLVLAVGPEGGFSPAEAGMAIEHGFVPVSLGPRVLRTETAAVVFVALVSFLAGRL